MLNTDVTRIGPLFDGRADAAMTRGAEAARRALATEAERITQSLFAGDIRHGTGRFLSSITSTDRSKQYSTDGYTLPVTVDRATDTVVTTDLATYGPWLEGTGSRNQTTRFKGYHGFRRASQALDAQAGAMAETALAPSVGEANA